MRTMQDELKGYGLPPPQCEMGYPEAQLREHFSPQRMERLTKWMYGQTMSICAGEHCNASHGVVIYAHDIYRFLVGLPVVD